MESSRRIEAGNDGFHPKPELATVPKQPAKITIFKAPRPILTDTATHEPIYAGLITPEGFNSLEGNMQEAVLLNLMETDNKDQIRKLRPDFEIDRPLTYDEKRLSEWTASITSHEEPILAPRIEIEDGLFAQIHHTVYYDFEKREDLAVVLERERQRRIQFTPGQFAPSENLGKYSAAIRYRGNLERQIQNK